MDKKTVSLIIPCRNEEKFIYKVLENILEQDYPTDLIDVVIADGLSDDDTVNEIKRFQSDHPQLNLQLIENPDRIVPPALNKSIELSKGEIVIRLDAHSVYPANYVSRLVEELNKREDAWNVGGCWDTQPGADTKMAKAIVAATSHPAGIGNADYRLKGTDVKSVDTVPFGCFPREVFDKIGLFDTDLVRNQDDEFNARIIENGGKIYLIPELQIKYFARPNFSKMAKMFFQYGYFKPLVNKKRNKPATARQFAPPILVLSILCGWIPALFWTPFIFIYLAGLVLYIFGLLLVALTMSNSKGYKLLVWMAFFIIHFSYGWGYLRGILDFTALGVEKKGKTVNISR
ncbi:glycosyltransferase family 2 protein [Paracrocinitomix mangrovi]|uniref:glycosyltransferase family 2 protein n=1 Tax=Paracrocinitomix mangrovi TaxID=2862509 RepID=UPI001C8DDF8D|nr:glycosyltransferase family 2 protein [Paracrocinitomix mangrovi]UKN03304.1 glycosyltransferase family 2 protein [Paracrocinitomix mangrovi]